MPHAPRCSRTTAFAALLLLAACSAPDAGRGDVAAADYLRVVAAEEARPAGGPALDVLVQATDAARPELRAAAVRALGRIENPELASYIRPLLADADPGVRAQAADALAQSHHRGDGGRALAPLLARVEAEHDAFVRGALARALGRLQLDAADRRAAAHALLALSRREDGALPVEQAVGAALGMEAFARGARGTSPGPGIGPAVTARLRELATYDAGGTSGREGARIRTVALLGLIAAGGATDSALATGLADPEDAVRRVAASRLGRLAAPNDAVLDLVDRALADRSAQVRLEGVRAAAAVRDPRRCAALVSSANDDEATAVRLAALDALATPCPGGDDVRALLRRTAASLPAGAGAAWHDAAHALLALGVTDPAAATTLLGGFATHDNPFVRTYAARVAAQVGSVATLRGLRHDPDANTRAAALEGLARLQGRGADDALIAAVAEDDAPQVLLAAAPALQGTERPAEASTAALATLQRLGRRNEETLRDPRVALVALIGTLGDSSSASLLEPYLRDRDKAVAEKAAEVLGAWSGRHYLAAPRPVARRPLPTPADLRAMERGEIVLEMARGGEITLRLMPFQAPTNAFRLVELVRAGTLDGLTFHRVVPNFVVQGASPLANEYAGHGAFTRDEVGLPAQWRGTVGLSTRGRDTGDGQIYVNLVDNVRLDHDYTIFGIVTSGMDVVDGVLEGDVIRRATFRPAA